MQELVFGRRGVYGESSIEAGLQRVREHAARHPASASLQQFLGQLLLADGNRAEARKAFESARANNPGGAEANLALAQIDLQEGKLASARAALSTQVTADGKNLPARLLLAMVEQQENKPPAAIEQ